MLSADAILLLIPEYLDVRNSLDDVRLFLLFSNFS